MHRSGIIDSRRSSASESGCETARFCQPVSKMILFGVSTGALSGVVSRRLLMPVASSQTRTTGEMEFRGVRSSASICLRSSHGFFDSSFSLGPFSRAPKLSVFLFVNNVTTEIFRRPGRFVGTLAVAVTTSHNELAKVLLFCFILLFCLLF